METKSNYRTEDGQSDNKALWVDEKTHRLIKQLAAQSGRTMKEYIKNLVEEKAANDE